MNASAEHPSPLERLSRRTAFAAYLAVVAAGALVHEPWWDEAQAWLLARDVPLVDLLLTRLAYEGHPPLWYLLLAIPAKLGLPYASMHVLSALAGASAVWVWLFVLPRIPLPVRLLAPFTFFLAWQFTVVARSYVLMAPILFALAAIWDRRGRHLALFVGLLVALSAVAVHGSVIAIVLFASALPGLLAGRLDGEPVPRTRALAGTGVFAGTLLALAWMLWPPADLATRADIASPLAPGRLRAIAWWITRQLFWGDLNPASAGGLFALAVIGVTLIVLAVWLHRHRVLWLLAGSGAGLLAVSAMYFNLWHEGTFFVVLLFAAALGFARRRGSFTRLDLAATGLLLLVLARHVTWTANSLAYDARQPFTGSRKAAEFIAERGIDRRMVCGMGIRVLELQPYFQSGILTNFAPGAGAAWDWSEANDWPYPGDGPSSSELKRAWYARMTAAEPEYVVTAWGYRDEFLYAAALRRDSRYRLLATFPGQMYWKYARSYPIVFELYERSAVDSRRDGGDR